MYHNIAPHDDDIECQCDETAFKCSCNCMSIKTLVLLYITIWPELFIWNITSPFWPQITIYANILSIIGRIVLFTSVQNDRPGTRLLFNKIGITDSQYGKIVAWSQTKLAVSFHIAINAVLILATGYAWAYYTAPENKLFDCLNGSLLFIKGLLVVAWMFALMDHLNPSRDT